MFLMHKFEGFINCTVCDTIYGEQESTYFYISVDKF